MKLLYLLLLLFLLLPLSSAFNIEVYDSNIKPINNSHFKILSPDFKTLHFATNNALNFDVNKGPVLIIADNTKTLGADYIYELQDPHFVGKIYMLPAGTLRIKVFDKNGLIVTHASVMISCGTITYENLKTDKFGSLEKEVPAGSCEVKASNNGYQGSLDVTINHGTITSDAKIILNNKLSGFINIPFLVSLSILLFILLILFITKYKNSEYFSKIQEKKIIYSKRTTDILNTLNDKETLIVNFLFKEESYQNKISRELQIPKTTFIRLINSLEKKNIIKIEKIGKTKKIKLTKWFLDEKERE